MWQHYAHPSQSYARGQVDISCVETTALLAPPIGPLYILSADGGVWKAVILTNIERDHIPEYSDYGSKSSREDMVGICTIIISKW